MYIINALKLKTPQMSPRFRRLVLSSSFQSIHSCTLCVETLNQYSILTLALSRKFIAYIHSFHSPAVYKAFVNLQSIHPTFFIRAQLRSIYTWVVFSIISSSDFLTNNLLIYFFFWQIQFSDSRRFRDDDVSLRNMPL